MAAGLKAAAATREVVTLPEPQYRFDAQAGTRMRNGNTIRRFSLRLGDAVRAAINDDRFAIVVGGDCSVLLGALYGLRRAGGTGLVHIDGHSDFGHPGATYYDSPAHLNSVAGMDLALATGRGEKLLTDWPEIPGPLVHDEDAIQIGERNALDPDLAKYYGDLSLTGMTRLIIQDVLKMGIPATAEMVLTRMAERRLERAWMHLDLDVLDQSVMAAVDSPGSPGLGYAQLGELMGMLIHSGRFRGMTIAIYDPEKDPEGRQGRRIVRMLGAALDCLPCARIPGRERLAPPAVR